MYCSQDEATTHSDDMTWPGMNEADKSFLEFICIIKFKGDLCDRGRHLLLFSPGATIFCYQMHTFVQYSADLDC